MPDATPGVSGTPNYSAGWGIGLASIVMFPVVFRPLVIGRFVTLRPRPEDLLSLDVWKIIVFPPLLIVLPLARYCSRGKNPEKTRPLLDRWFGNAMLATIAIALLMQVTALSYIRS
jgi:hypothetical protein